MKTGKRTRIEKTMMPFAVVVLAGLLLMLTIQTGYGQSHEKVIKLTFALFQPATAGLSKANTEFAKEIEKRTNGRVQIQVFQSGSLLGAPAMFQGIRNGIADMGNGITSYSPGNFPFTSIAELPNGAQSGWVASNAQYDFLAKYQPKEWNDVHVLTVVSSGYDIAGIGTAKKPIQKLEDWKGKSIRTNHAEIITALGGTVKDIPMAEVYDAVSKGVLDGVVGGLEPFKGWKLGDVSKFFTVNQAPVQPSIMWYNAMNKAKWNSLPADIQQIITEVSREYSGKLGLAWDEQAVAGVEYCKSVGDTIYVLPKSEADRFVAAILPVIDARLKNLTSKGFSQKEVEDAWTYFKSRIDYWNGQQASHNVTPLMARVEKVLK
jgi:TRAP-type C4-dicarboxylate transport system substrate-binding protein